MKKLLPLLFVAVSLVAREKPVYFAPVPPPPALEEKRGLPPEPGQFWIAGFWGYEGGRHVWHAGHWEKVPRPKARYIEPRWDRKGSQYVFYAGRWK